jgi:CubicO group peptidase (beta-lactamase class C family)
VPRQLAAYAVKREPGFRYSNFGPYVWSTMMEAKLGVPWRDMIDRKVLETLELERTSARLEDFSVDEVARCHAWMGGRWQLAPLKPTPILNAAGGIYTSGRDSGRFLKAFLTDGKSAQGRVAATALRRSWERLSVQDRDFFGLHRDGYGWVGISDRMTITGLSRARAALPVAGPSSCSCRRRSLESRS